MESARHHQAAKLDEWTAAGELDEPAEAVLDRTSYHPSAGDAVAGDTVRDRNRNRGSGDQTGRSSPSWTGSAPLPYQ